jgi:aspartate carbamoyltransferase catalytic subunit
MNTKSVRHVLSVSDLSVTEILSVLSMAALIKQRITVTNTFAPDPSFI